MVAAVSVVGCRLVARHAGTAPTPASPSQALRGGRRPAGAGGGGPGGTLNQYTSVTVSCPHLAIPAARREGKAGSRLFFHLYYSDQCSHLR